MSHKFTCAIVLNLARFGSNDPAKSQAMSGLVSGGGMESNLGDSSESVIRRARFVAFLISLGICSCRPATIPAMRFACMHSSEWRPREIPYGSFFCPPSAL
jgi:hypothetical protein